MGSQPETRHRPPEPIAPQKRRAPRPAQKQGALSVTARRFLPQPGPEGAPTAKNPSRDSRNGCFGLPRRLVRYGQGLGLSMTLASFLAAPSGKLPSRSPCRCHSDRSAKLGLTRRLAPRGPEGAPTAKSPSRDSRNGCFGLPRRLVRRGQGLGLSMTLASFLAAPVPPQRHGGLRMTDAATEGLPCTYTRIGPSEGRPAPGPEYSRPRQSGQPGSRPGAGHPRQLPAPDPL